MSGQPGFKLYVKKIEGREGLPTAARDALLNVSFQIREIAANHDFVREGDRPGRSCLVVSGLVSRHRTLRNGSRQILSFHVPGDMVDLQSALVMVADHGIRTHAPTTLVTVSHADVLKLAADHPALGRAFWFDTLIDAAIFREWTVNVGRRNAHARTAHLILEIASKMRMAGLMDADTFDFPITQSDLADALSITAVHLNRVLQQFRRSALIRTHLRTMTLLNERELGALAGFDPTYLHQEGPRPQPSGVLSRQTE